MSRKKKSRRRRTGKHPAFRFLWRTTLYALLTILLASALPVLALRWLDPPTSSVMLQERFADPSTSHPRYRWLELAQISPQFALAVIAAEDQKFPLHYGFDFASIGAAMSENRRGGRLRGASTISQQVAKNLFLWNGRSYMRKGMEAWLTVLIELAWPKQRILEIYMNIAQLGPRLFGVGAASEAYFQTPAARLRPEQAAMLAAVLPAPSRYRVTAPTPYLRKRQQWILAQMNALGGTGYLRGIGL